MIYYSPFDVGFEALGEIVAVGSSVPKDKIGSHVIYTQYGAFAEYVEISQRAVIPVPVRKIQKSMKYIVLTVFFFFFS
jgi:NADPH:quinone reductase-like Zn-dependent oxidoreductase